MDALRGRILRVESRLLSVKISPVALGRIVTTYTIIDFTSFMPVLAVPADLTR